jgi:hypothetical protein
MRCAAAASSSVESRFSHEYPGEVGSRGSNPVGREDGAIAAHGTTTLTYVAPADRDSANAVRPYVLLNSAGSKRPVTSGAEPGVEYVAVPRASPADAVAAARHSIAPPIAR